ncbi:unnamed protein product, partial [Discosporangium mesarthrocarpum]
SNSSKYWGIPCHKCWQSWRGLVLWVLRIRVREFRGYVQVGTVQRPDQANPLDVKVPHAGFDLFFLFPSRACDTPLHSLTQRVTHFAWRVGRLFEPVRECFCEPMPRTAFSLVPRTAKERERHCVGRCTCSVCCVAFCSRVVVL